MTEVTVSDFDYGELDGETWKFVKDATDEIRRLGKQTAENIVAIGRHISEVKARLPWGQYGHWLKAELGWSASTADNFMNCYALSNSPTVVELEAFTSMLTAHTAAAYELARPSTPDQVRQEVLTKVEQGEKVTAHDVRETVHRHKVERARAAAGQLHMEPIVITAAPFTIKTEPIPAALSPGRIAAARQRWQGYLAREASQVEPSAALQKQIKDLQQEIAQLRDERHTLKGEAQHARAALEVKGNGDPVSCFMAAYYRMDNRQRNELAKQILKAQLGETDLLPKQKQHLNQVLDVLTDYTPRPATH